MLEYMKRIGLGLSATMNKNIIDLYNQNYFNYLFDDTEAIEFKHIEQLSECLRDDFADITTTTAITVVIPTYCRIDSIRRAIECLKNQKDCSLFSILVICDDPRPSIIDDFMLKVDLNNVIYYKNKKNLGVFGNWNLGVFLSKTKWVTVLCDDDYLYIDYMKTVQDLIYKNPEKKYFLTGHDRAIGNLTDEITEKINDFQIQYLRKGGNGFYKKQNKSRRHDINFDDYALTDQLYKIPLGDIYLRDVFLRLGGMQQRFYPAGDCAMILRYLDKEGGLYYYYGKAGCVSVGMNESIKPENIEKSRSQVAAMRMISLDRSSLPLKFIIKKEIELSVEDSNMLPFGMKLYRKILRLIKKLVNIIVKSRLNQSN